MTARGIRNNNPGNIDFNQGQFDRDPWVGELGLEDHPHARFTTFDTPEHGIRALTKILLTYQRKYGLLTVRGMISRWAPPSENNTEVYVEQVCSKVGCEPDDEWSLKTGGEKTRRLVEAIIRHENGEQPYAQEVIDQGIGLALA